MSWDIPVIPGPPKSPICKLCVHYTLRYTQTLNCRHPRNIISDVINIVDGNPIFIDTLVRIRINSDLCGEAGNWFKSYAEASAEFKNLAQQTRAGGKPSIDEL